jgi:hypothetical protein
MARTTRLAALVTNFLADVPHRDDVASAIAALSPEDRLQLRGDVPKLQKYLKELDHRLSLHVDAESLLDAFREKGGAAQSLFIEWLDLRRPGYFPARVSAHPEVKVAFGELRSLAGLCSPEELERFRERVRG